MCLGLCEGTLEPATPLLFNGLTVEHCLSTVLDGFLNLLLERFLVEIKHIMDHFGAAQEGKTLKHEGKMCSWPKFNNCWAFKFNRLGGRLLEGPSTRGQLTLGQLDAFSDVLARRSRFGQMLIDELSGSLLGHV